LTLKVAIFTTPGQSAQTSCCYLPPAGLLHKADQLR
jgi:hypothetical protein